MTGPKPPKFKRISWSSAKGTSSLFGLKQLIWLPWLWLPLASQAETSAATPTQADRLSDPVDNPGAATSQSGVAPLEAQIAQTAQNATDQAISRADNSAVANTVPVASELLPGQTSNLIVEPVQTPRRVSAINQVRGRVTRLLQRFGLGPDRTQLEPTVEVEVIGADSDEALKTNLIAALTRTAVAELSHLQDSATRLRKQARDAAQAVGYYQPVFRFAARPPDTLQVIVDPGAPVKITQQQIEIEGPARDDPAFQALLNDPPIKPGAILHQGHYEQFKGAISELGAERGYFDKTWLIHDVAVRLPANTAEVDLKWRSGPRYRFDQIEFLSSDPKVPLPVRPDLLAQLVPFEAGEPFDATLVSRLSRNLQQTRWFNTALIDVQAPPPMEMRAVVGESTGDATEAQDITQTASTDVALPRNDKTTLADKINLPAASGDMTNAVPTSPAQVVSQKQPNAHQQAANAQGLVPVVVRINAQQPTTVEAGLGFGTDTGVRLRSQFRRNLINDRGHNLEGNLEVSKVRRAVELRYQLPYKHPLYDTLSVFTGYEYQAKNTAFDNWPTQTATVGIQRNLRPLGQPWQYNVSLRYRLDVLDLPEALQAENTDIIGNQNLLGKTRQQTLLFGGSATKLVSNDATNPTQGYRLVFQADGGSQAILSDTDLLILRASARGLRTSRNGLHQYSARVDAGHIFSRDFGLVPPSLRFYAGGDQSVRGYDYRSLSPQQAFAGYGPVNIGGNNLLTGSVEYAYQFRPKWWGAGFIDAGSAYNNQFSNKTYVGVGGGIRFGTPIGPVRIDVAAGISESQVPIRLYFFIGPPL